MSDSVSVGVRLRPLNARERAGAASAACAGGEAPPAAAWAADAAAGRVLRTGAAAGRAHEFTYDHVFEPTATNEDVYADLACPVVEAALAGYNGTVFAYGQTSSGKTHSMLGNGGDRGITPRAVAHVMRVMEEAAGGRRYAVRATYCEIYNEVIRDLLNADAGEIKVRENARGATFIDASEFSVASEAAAMALLERGQALRAVGETAMNETSSRSHTIFTLIIESVGEAVGSEKCHRSSVLHLVDLAGSERAKSTHASGARLREGSHINKSLLTLGTIINKLSADGGGSGGAQHLPYRDSKLTRVLRDALGGNSRTAVLCAVTPSPVHAEETLGTLKFAERAKNVTNSAVRNETVDYKAKYREALAELEVLRGRGAGAGGRPGDGAGGGAPGAAEGATAGDALSLTVELHRAREEVAHLRERAETAELDAAHGGDKLRVKTGEVRALRAEAAALREKMLELSGKQETLQLSLVQAFFKIEDVRRNIQLSRKKGLRVLQAEEDLYAVSIKLAMFIPDEVHEAHQAKVEAQKATLPRAGPAEGRSTCSRTGGSGSGGSVSEDPGDPESSPPSPSSRANAPAATSHPVATAAVGGEDGPLAASPLTPETGATEAADPPPRPAPAAPSSPPAPMPRSPDVRPTADGGGSSGGSPREEDAAECRSSGIDGAAGGGERTGQPPPIPILDFDACDEDPPPLNGGAHQSSDSPASQGSPVGGGGILDSARRAWKRKPFMAMRSFYGAGTDMERRDLADGRKVSSS